jgi:MFS family permease
MNEQSPAAINTHDHVRFNTFVNIMDGAFFGSALGLASFTTIIPLFISQLTDSAILIGLAPAIHVVGWQLPQLLTAGRVRRLSRFKPMVLAMTVHERMPFLGLALLAWFLPGISDTTALVLVFTLLVWQGLGGGYTANVWQSMIAKIIPVAWLGGFFGAQSSAANLGAAITAVAAGQILERYSYPYNFALCYALAGVGMVISFLFIAATREHDHTPAHTSGTREHDWKEIVRIIRTDVAFQRFLIIRMVFHLGMTAFSYYAVYVVDKLGASVGLVGWLTGVLIFSEVILNPLLGMLGDRRGRELVLVVGAFAAMSSSLLAGWMTSIPAWFLIFILAGAGYAVGWTTTMVLSIEFGNLSEQATYIGMSNTFIAPVSLMAPFLAGWSIEVFGYTAMFRGSAVVFLVAVGLSWSLLRSRTSIHAYQHK